MDACAAWQARGLPWVTREVRQVQPLREVSLVKRPF
jgi:hypothetical protein